MDFVDLKKKKFQSVILKRSIMSVYSPQEMNAEEEESIAEVCSCGCACVCVCVCVYVCVFSKKYC